MKSRKDDFVKQFNTIKHMHNNTKNIICCYISPLLTMLTQNLLGYYDDRFMIIIPKCVLIGFGNYRLINKGLQLCNGEMESSSIVSFSFQ